MDIADLDFRPCPCGYQVRSLFFPHPCEMTNSGSPLRSVVSVGITSRKTSMDDVPHAGESTRTKLFSLNQSNPRSACVSSLDLRGLTDGFRSHKRLTQQKKRRDRERKDLETLGRRHLTNVRVVQRNVVYIVNMNPRIAKEEVGRATTSRWCHFVADCIYLVDPNVTLQRLLWSVRKDI